MPVASELEKLGVSVIPPRGRPSCFSYVFSGDPVIVVDPGFNFEEIAEKIQKAPKIVVILTHSHADHSTGAVFLAEKFGCLVYASQNADFSKDSTLEQWFGEDLGGLRELGKNGKIKKLKDGDRIGNENFSFTVLETPGHSADSLCLLEEKKKILVSGDSLENYRDDLPASDPEEHEKSIDRADALLWKTGGKFWRLTGHSLGRT